MTAPRADPTVYTPDMPLKANNDEILLCVGKIDSIPLYHCDNALSEVFVLCYSPTHQMYKRTEPTYKAAHFVYKLHACALRTSDTDNLLQAHVGIMVSMAGAPILVEYIFTQFTVNYLPLKLASEFKRNSRLRHTASHPASLGGAQWVPRLFYG